MNGNKKDMVTFFDMLGRTIIGERVEESTKELHIKNPVVVNVVPRQMQDPNTGEVVTNMSLQLLPLFFREFLGEPDAGITYNYSKSIIVMPTVQPVFDFKMSVRYDSLSAPVQNSGKIAQTLDSTPGANANQESGKVIKLFDE